MREQEQSDASSRVVATHCGRAAVLAAAGAALVAACLYLPSLRGEFVYDDRAQILVDTVIHQPASIGDILSLRVLCLDVIDRARPVQLLSLALDAALWGRQPFGYRLTNLLLHVANTGLLALLLAAWLAPRGQAAQDCAAPASAAAVFLAAALFAVHPVLTEAVCVPTFREDLLATLFLLLALLAATRFAAATAVSAGARGAGWGAGCVLCLTLAAGAKETGILGPALLLGVWRVLGRGSSAKPWLALLGAASAAVATFVVATHALAPMPSEIFFESPERLGGTLAQTLRIQPRIWAFQLSQILWPSRLCADYGPYSVRHIGLGLAVPVVLGVGVGLGLWAWHDRRAFLGLALLGVGLLPVANLVPIYRPLADRYLYLPMTGVAVLAGIMWCRAWRRVPARGAMTLAAGGILLGAALAAGTVARIRVWQGSLSLWQNTAARNPQSSTAANNLAFALHDHGRHAEAVASWRRAVELTEGRQGALWAGLALGLAALGHRDMADAAANQALTLEPRLGNARRLATQFFWEPRYAVAFTQIVARFERVSDAAR